MSVDKKPIEAAMDAAASYLALSGADDFERSIFGFEHLVSIGNERLREVFRFLDNVIGEAERQEVWAPELSPLVAYTYRELYGQIHTIGLLMLYLQGREAAERAVLDITQQISRITGSVIASRKQAWPSARSKSYQWNKWVKP